MTTVASGRWISEPTPVASNKGNSPSAAIVAVISTGRSRLSAPRRMASSTSSPRQWRLIASTSTTPLSTATPNRAIKPMLDGTDRYWPEMASATTPPISAIGTLSMMSAACPMEWNMKYSSRKISSREIGTTTISRACARCWFLYWPPNTTE